MEGSVITELRNTDFLIEVAKGNIPKHSIVHKFGSAQDVGTSMTPLTTAKTYETPLASTSLELISSVTGDTSGGSGAWKVEVIGIGSGWTELSQDVDMNGTTAVPLPTDLYRGYRLKIKESGTYGSSSASSHSSSITLRESGGGTTWGQIVTDSSIGLGQSEIGVYTIPKGITGYIIQKSIVIEANKPARIFLFAREDADIVTAPFSPMLVKEVERGVENPLTRKFNSPLGPFVGPCDIGFMGSFDTGTGDIGVEFEILLVED